MLLVAHLGRQRDLGVHAPLRLVHEIAILVRDLRNEHLAAVLHEMLEEAQKEPRRAIFVRLRQHRQLLLGGDLRRLEEAAQAIVALDGARDVVDQPPPRLQVARLPREREERLGVVPCDRGIAHQPWPRAGTVARKLSTSFRFDSPSRLRSRTLDAPAIARSTASRRRSAIARLRSLSISTRARSRSSCCWCFVCSSISLRSFSPVIRLSAIMRCASARAASSAFTCSASCFAAASRSFFACWIASSSARSRASTAAVSGLNA